MGGKVAQVWRKVRPAICQCRRSGFLLRQKSFPAAGNCGKKSPRVWITRGHDRVLSVSKRICRYMQCVVCDPPRSTRRGAAHTNGPTPSDPSKLYECHFGQDLVRTDNWSFLRARKKQPLRQEEFGENNICWFHYSSTGEIKRVKAGNCIENKLQQSSTQNYENKTMRKKGDTHTNKNNTESTNQYKTEEIYKIVWKWITHFIFVISVRPILANHAYLNESFTIL